MEIYLPESWSASDRPEPGHGVREPCVTLYPGEQPTLLGSGLAHRRPPPGSARGLLPAFRRAFSRSAQRPVRLAKSDREGGSVDEPAGVPPRGSRAGSAAAALEAPAPLFRLDTFGDP